MSWTHLEDRIVHGRKRCRCVLCDLPIKRGARHVVRSCVDDGEFAWLRMHEVCESLSQSWDEWEWECHDPHDFRDKDLRLPLIDAVLIRVAAEAAEGD